MRDALHKSQRTEPRSRRHRHQPCSRGTHLYFDKNLILQLRQLWTLNLQREQAHFQLGLVPVHAHSRVYRPQINAEAGIQYPWL
jgi:hypothetical protein